MFNDIYINSPVFLQNIILNAYAYKRLGKRKYRDFEKLNKKIHDLYNCNDSEYLEYIDKKLSIYLKNCYEEIPFYKDRLKGFVGSSNDFGLELVSKLPALTREEIREKYSSLINGSQKDYFKNLTSGTTGTPFEYLLDENSYKFSMALVKSLEMELAGKEQYRIATFAGRMITKSSSKPPYHRMNRVENQVLLSSYNINSETVSEYIRVLEKYRPDIIIGYPSVISELAVESEKKSLKLSYRPKKIVSNSEKLYGYQVKAMESFFNCPVVDYYSTAESLFFAKRDSENKYLVNPLLGFFQIDKSIDDLGSIYATSLENKRLPLIKYKVGDYISYDENDLLEYGIVRRFRTVEGRLDDLVRTKDGRSIGQVLIFVKGEPFIESCQLVQKGFESFTLRVVTKDNKKVDHTKLQRSLSERIGYPVSLNIEYLDEIPRTKSGKFKTTIVEM